MKKINGLLLSLTVASLIGCGGGGGSSSGSSATTSGSAVTNGSTTDTSNSTNTGTSTTTSATTPLSYLNSLRNLYYLPFKCSFVWLPAAASNLAAICRQCCCHMPATLLAAADY